jgi:hypothetical protein
MKTNRETRNVLIVRPEGNVAKFARGQEVVNCIGLAGTDFEQEAAAGGETRGGGVDEAADEVESVGAAVKGRGGIVADFGGEGRDFVRRDVREIGEEEVEFDPAGWEEIGLVESDAVGQIVAVGVGGGEGEGVGRGVGGVEGGGRKFESDGEHYDTAAGADVEEGGRVELLGEFEGEFDELFGLGAGDEGSLVGGEGASVEFGGAEDVLEGFAGAAAFDEVAQRGALGFGKRAVS